MSVKSELVSVIMPFFNTPRDFLREAINSVLSQTYRHWELLIVDDGSTQQKSIAVVQQLVAEQPDRIRYLTHKNRLNRGCRPSRQLGISQAKGAFIALLDSDDLWPKEKLAEQVALLAEYPDVAMIYGNARYWRSWRSTDEKSASHRDRVYRLRIGKQRLFEPAEAIPLFLENRIEVPCPSSIMMRKGLLERLEGIHHESFDQTVVDASSAGDTDAQAFHILNNVYEDQIIYAQVNLNYPILGVEKVWVNYRQHDGGVYQSIQRLGDLVKTRRLFLAWLDQFIVGQTSVNTTLTAAIQRQKWVCQPSHYFSDDGKIYFILYRIRKWVSKLRKYKSVFQIKWG